MICTLAAVAHALAWAVLWTVTWVGRTAARVWGRIHEPRVAKVFHLIGYLLAVGIGAVTLWRPPTSIETPLGPTLTTIWGALILTGAVAAAVAVLPGWWWLERIGIYCVATGALIYFAVVMTLHVQGPPGASRLTQAGVILAFAWLVSANRLWEIRGYTFEPRGR
ncbi:hypothetical protein LPW41_11665 [Microbacterium sp. JC 701]|uniref:hypothetical protein n=1 Tax=Microbacterium sp. JC 701 TaxID=2897389 RepID=UPI001E5AF138|nr:hypothetical protein [Microbacterium sp. JC 701]MCD2170354.1 hypothetical protein [Microbacterium sp. JC 701]